MISKPLTFEQDKTAIFIRNQDLYLHFTKLDSIKQRKNAYLPEISQTKNQINLKKTFSTPALRDKQFFISRDNKIIFQKLDKINRRANKLNSQTEIIDGYLNEKKFNLDKFREIQKDSLFKENVKLRERISNTKPVIDNKIFDNDFEKLKKISGYLRKVKPQNNVGNIYLNRKETQLLRKYVKEKNEYLLKSNQKDNNKDKDKIFFTRRRNLSNTIDTNKLNTHTFNLKSKFPFNIDKKILKKIAYI